MITPPSSAELTQPSPLLVEYAPVSTLLQCLVKVTRTFPAVLHEALSDTDLGLFIYEILKRLRASKTSIFLTCYYLSRLARATVTGLPLVKHLFLGCLILAFKFLRDFNFSFKTWSLMSGLEVRELQSVERAVLGGLDYDLYLNGASFTKFDVLLTAWLDDAENMHKMAMVTSFAKEATLSIATSIPAVLIIPAALTAHPAAASEMRKMPLTPSSIEIEGGKKRRFSDLSNDDESAAHVAFLYSLKRRSTAV